MKKAWLITLCFIVVLFGCDNNTITEEREPDNKETNALIYSENGVRFEVPEVWEDFFSDSVSTNGTGDFTYTTIEFIYTDNEAAVPIMMISRFTDEQWEILTAQDEEAEEGFIGKSANGKNYYHIYYAELDYFTDNTRKERFNQVKEEARRLKSEITITE